jgi:phage anti-repressor protein
MVAADGLFKVYAGELDGHPCRLVNARDLYKALNASWKPFPAWFRERAEGAGWREGRDYRQVFVKVGQYDPYLSLDAALQLLALEKSPNKAEAQVFLQQVALGQPATLEGVAARVRECSALPAVPAFPDEGLVTVAMGEIGGKSRPICNGRDLHHFLEVGRDFSTWIKDRIDEYGFVEGKDYSPVLGNRSDGRPGKRRIEYQISLEMAKELAMVENNEQGRKVRRYFIKCEELVLAWHEQVIAIANTRLASITLPDTSSREPLVFDFQDTRGHLLQVRVAIRNGRAECVALDLANALGEREPDFLKWYAAIPKLYHGSIPSPSGETALATLSAEGLAYLFGQRAHRPEVDAFRNFWFGAVEPALAARRAGAAASGKATSEAARAADPALAETVPAEATEWPEASDDTLRARFGELAAWLWRRDGGNAGAAFPNAAALLARLWRETDGVWLATGTRNGFARSLGMAHGKSAEQGLARLVAWGLVEVRPEGAAWPSEIRLNREKVLAALREAELAVFARENVHGEIRHRDA